MIMVQYTALINCPFGLVTTVIAQCCFINMLVLSFLVGEQQVLSKIWHFGYEPPRLCEPLLTSFFGTSPPGLFSIIFPNMS